jgi:hypothetical protein
MFEARSAACADSFSTTPAHGGSMGQSGSMGQEATEKWTAGRVLQPE